MSDATSPTHRTTEVLLVLMALIWGVNFSVAKYGTQVLAPLAYNATRMTLGCIVLLLVAHASKGARASRQDRWSLMKLGVLGHGIYQILFINGLALTRAGTAALVVAASPAVVALVARAHGHERLSWRAISGIALSIMGVIFVVGGTIQADGSAHVIGDLLILVAIVCWAFYNAGLLPLTKRIAGLEIAAWTLVGGVVPLLVVATPQLIATDWSAVAPKTWGAIVYSGILALVVAYLFWYRGVRDIGATRTAMFANLQPVVAILVAWVALGEIPTIYQGVGTATVMAGLYLSRAR